MNKIKLQPLNRLKPHEKISLLRGIPLLFHVVRHKHLPAPLIIDDLTGVILDGHHRRWVCAILGITEVPCVCVSYSDPRISLESRRPDIKVTKSEVIAAGLAGKKFPAKTTRHILSFI